MVEQPVHFDIAFSPDMDQSNFSEVQRFTYASVDFFCAQPRHLLGALAHDLEILSTLDAIKMHEQSGNTNSGVAEGLSFNYQRIREENIKRNSWQDFQIFYPKLLAERDFWRGCHTINQGVMPSYWEWLDVLKIAIEIPSAVPYINAGIDDANLIKAAVCEGIDVETARVLAEVGGSNTVGNLLAMSGGSR